MNEDSAAPSLGDEIKRLRVTRGLSRRVLADMCGWTPQYQGMLERGDRVVDKRSTLESLARALRVSPVNLGAPAGPISLASANPALAEALAGVGDVEAALTEVVFGEAAGPVRPWEAVAADVHHLNTVWRPNAAYGTQTRVIPSLIRELNGHIAASPKVHRDALIALMNVYSAAVMLTKYLRIRGLPAVAAMHAHRIAQELDDPAWIGVASYLRAMTMGVGRERMRELALQAADGVTADGGGEGTREVYGMLHLTAAIASAAIQDEVSAADHLSEAWEVAEKLDERPGHGFANLHFSTANVRFWRMAIAVELGEHGRAREIHARVNPTAVPSSSRQSAYWADLGRALANTRDTRERAVEALLQAERLAPARLTADIYVRETVIDLLPRVKRDSTAGRELRGLAYRMAVAG